MHDDDRTPQMKADNAKTDHTQPENMDAAAREQLLRSYVERLTKGEDLESVRADFVKHFEDVDALEIANAEQHLIKSGVSYADVTKLCDVHSALFHGATKQERVANAERAVMASKKAHETIGAGKNQRKEAEARCRELVREPGHPLHIMTLENEAITAQLEVIRERRPHASEEELIQEVQKLRAVGTHYAKKGDIFYTLLKQRYHITGPSDVMWSVDDEILDELRAVTADREVEDRMDRMDAALQRIQEMVFKETNILFPICVQFFQPEEWQEIRRDMDDYALCLVDEVPAWSEASSDDYRSKRQREGSDASGDAEVIFAGGHMTVEQLEAVLNTIPLELTFVDADDINRFYNDNGQPKLFKRPLSSLDRSLYLCHPPKIEPMVRRIIASFRAGEKDVVSVWMKKGGEDAYVSYRAVRAADGTYLGTLECVMPMGFAKEHYER